MDFNAILSVLQLFSQAHVLMLVILGNLIGLIFGAIPGLAGGMAFVVLLPLTFGWDPRVALLFLVGTLGAQYFGGSIPAILINVPGTSMNAATCFDGYPMSQRGEAGRALSIASFASALGAMVGFLVLILVMPIMRQMVLLFGPPEIFWIVIVGLTAIAMAVQGNFLQGIISGGLGLLLSLVGFSPALGVERYTLGTTYFWDGIQLIPLFIGLFAIAQMIDYINRGVSVAQAGHIKTGWGVIRQGIVDVFQHFGCFLRSSVIGTVVGIIPGVGGTAANFISYTVAQQFSRHPEKFHHGALEGVIASESSNNAKEGGSLIPTLAFGIPGSFEGALVLAALMVHGIQIGPNLIRYNAEIVWTLIIGLIISNLFASLFGMLSINALCRVTLAPVRFVGPTIMVFSLVGSYLWRENLWDVLFAIVLGFLGYVFIKAGFSVVTLIIGFVLGNIAEKAFYQSLGMALGDWSVFVRFPAVLFLLLAVLILVVVGRRSRNAPAKNA